MTEELSLKKIAVIRTDFPEKFGIPRQSGIADTRGEIVFEPEFRNPDALRGLEEYSHIWVLWGFSETKQENWHATVRPPRLGGNQRMGVFATRSPFRPNPVGLSCLKLVEIRATENQGMVLVAEGADMLDGTPIYDIKPYLPYVDCKLDALGGFAERHKGDDLEVYFADDLEEKVPKEKRQVLRQILAQDPRPSYQEDPERIYGMDYAGMEIHFRVDQKCLTVCGVNGCKRKRKSLSQIM